MTRAPVASARCKAAPTAAPPRAMGSGGRDSGGRESLRGGDAVAEGCEEQTDGQTESPPRRNGTRGDSGAGGKGEPGVNECRGEAAAGASGARRVNGDAAAFKRGLSAGRRWWGGWFRGDLRQRGRTRGAPPSPPAPFLSGTLPLGEAGLGSPAWRQRGARPGAARPGAAQPVPAQPVPLSPAPSRPVAAGDAGAGLPGSCSAAGPAPV